MKTAMETITVLGRRFHPVWLRDNCLCPLCREPGSFQKTVDIGALLRSGGPTPAEVQLIGDVLIVDWVENPAHRSVFPVSWLLAHAYDPPGEPQLVEPEIHWDASAWAVAPPDSYRIDDCDPDHGPWTDDLMRYGFALLEDVTEDSLDRFVGRIGPVLETEFGHVIKIRSEPDATDLALSGTELSAHTDFSAHMHTPPVLQFMLCVEQEATGGASIVVDGFRAAEKLRNDHPEHFARLAGTPVNFQQFYADRRYFHKRSRPLLEVDRDDRVTGVFFAHSHACNWVLPPAEVEPFYAAYHAFFDYLKDPAYQLRIRLTAGQCMVLRNGRMLHGRTAYDPTSGGRTLVTEFVAWEYFEARRRFHQYRDLYLGPQQPGTPG